MSGRASSGDGDGRSTVGRVHARAGLVGNPSDGYGGRVVAASVGDFSAAVECRASDRVVLRPGPADAREWEDLDAFAQDVEARGYHGGIRLLKAALHTFRAHCRERGIRLEGGFALTYRTDIPVRVGLAGSSAIVTAAFRALQRFFGVEIEREAIPTLALAAEREELGIAAGLMDRVIQVYGGLVYMELEEERLERTGRGRYEPLDPAALPPLYLAWHPGLAQGSEEVHGDLRARYEAGDPEVLSAMRRCAGAATEARDLLRAGRGDEIGPLMDESFDQRARVAHVGGNRRLVEAGRRLGGGVNQAGSGGAVVGTWDGDPERLARLRAAYEELGARFIVPEVGAPAP